MAESPKTVSMLLIGNELLTGKIQDVNGHYAAKRLRSLGAVLKRIEVVPDDQDIIVSALNRLRTSSDFVVTSGGVGPTHDDITLEAVAVAFGVTTYLEPGLEKMIRGFFKEKTTRYHLRMATIPRTSRLIDVEGTTWPVVANENVFILPGVPEIFRAKFEGIAQYFRSGHWYLRSVYLDTEEGVIAAILEDIEATLDVTIGSYPRWRGADYRIRVTIESRAKQPVDQAMRILEDALSPGEIVRIDPEAQAVDHLLEK